jgi:hypothetical protein
MVLVSLQWIKGTQFFTAAGVPLAAGDLFIQDATTTNHRTTYSNAAGTVANTFTSNRIVLDAGGKLDESVYIPTGLWKYTLRDSGGTTIESEDSLLGALDTSVFLTGSVTAETPVISKTADYTIVDGDQTKVINANSTGSTFTLTLPSAVTVGDGWRVTVRMTGTANQVNIATVSAQTINAQSSLALTVYLEAITLVSDGANWHVSETANSPVVARKFVAAGLGFSLIGGNIIVSVAADAVTFAIKTAAGNDPSSFTPVKVVLRGQTAAEEEYATISITAATSLTISTTSTMGTVNSTPFKLWLIGIDDAGTYRLGAINCVTGVNIYPLGQFPLVSSTAEGGAGGADSAHVVYTGAAVSSKPYHVLGYASWESGLGTAGVWGSAPTRFQLYGPGVPLPGTVIQSLVNQTGEVGSGTTVIPIDNSIPQQSTEGDLYMSQAITPTSATNILEIDALANMSAATANRALVAALFQDTTANALKAASSYPDNTVSAVLVQTKLRHKMLAATTSATTFKIHGGPDVAATVTFNGHSAGRIFGGVMNSYLEVKEIMT